MISAVREAEEQRNRRHRDGDSQTVCETHYGGVNADVQKVWGALLETLQSFRCEKVERVKGIEPSSRAWEAYVLPLNHTRFRAAGFSKTSVA